MGARPEKGRLAAKPVWTGLTSCVHFFFFFKLVLADCLTLGTFDIETLPAGQSKLSVCKGRSPIGRGGSRGGVRGHLVMSQNEGSGHLRATVG